MSPAELLGSIRIPQATCFPTSAQLVHQMITDQPTHMAGQEEDTAHVSRGNGTRFHAWRRQHAEAATVNSSSVQHDTAHASSYHEQAYGQAMHIAQIHSRNMW